MVKRSPGNGYLYHVSASCPGGFSYNVGRAPIDPAAIFPFLVETLPSGRDGDGKNIFVRRFERPVFGINKKLYAIVMRGVSRS